MGLENIHLKKLLQLMFCDARILDSKIRQDIRNTIEQEHGQNTGGGDFHVPFWADAKRHVFNGVDLRQSTATRIEANRRKARLYPQLCDGFLLWWNQRRRWSNAPFIEGQQMTGAIEFPELPGRVKVENMLTVEDGGHEERAIYPYFAEGPPLGIDAARLGLWALTCALPDIPSNEFRILDVIRGQTFAAIDVDFIGNEEMEFSRRYGDILARRDELLPEYQ